MINENRHFDDSTDNIYKLLFEKSSDAKILVNTDGVILKTNKAFSVMFGYTKLEVLKNCISTLIQEKYRSNTGKDLLFNIKYSLNEKVEAINNLDVQKKDGTLFSIEITLNYISFENDVLVVVDISDVILSELKKELSIRKKEFKLATEAANVGIWSALRNGNLSENSILENFRWAVNDQVAFQMGYPKGQVLQFKDFKKVIHPDDLYAITSAYKNAIKKNQKYKIVYRVLPPNGGLRYIESKGVVKFDEFNQIERIDGVTLDVTKHKSAEARRVIYNNIAQKLNSNVSVFDFCKFIEIELNKIISIHKVYVMLYDSDNNHLTSIYINDSLKGFDDNVNRKNGNGLCEYVINNKKGLSLNKAEYEKFLSKNSLVSYEEVKNYWMGVPLISENNAIGVITIDCIDSSIYTVQDLAILEFIGIQLGRLISRKQNHYRLKLLNATLEERVELRTYELNKAKNKITESLKKEKELSSLKSRFVSTASHQFRTPLTVIQTNLGILELQKNAFNEEHQVKFDKISKRIKDQISKMTFMMDDLLTIGKINESGINFKPIFINIVSLCQKIINSYNDIQSDGRVIEFEINGNQKGVFLDPVLMEHVLSALISNAFKYSDNRPNPILIINFLESEFQIRVKDFGIGIPKEEIQYIDEPFFRASNAIDISGTGLGTAIVKDYLDASGGELIIDSELNEYTQFKLLFKK